MFGSAYFGHRYFGRRYFGDGADIVVDQQPQISAVNRPIIQIPPITGELVGDLPMIVAHARGTSGSEMRRGRGNAQLLLKAGGKGYADCGGDEAIAIALASIL